MYCVKENVGRGREDTGRGGKKEKKKKMLNNNCSAFTLPEWNMTELCNVDENKGKGRERTEEANL